MRTNLSIVTLFYIHLTTLAYAAEPQLVPGHIPSVVPHLTPAGHPPATNRINLAIGLPLRNQDHLATLLRELYDPVSPNFHHWLTPEQFTERFCPTEHDYQKVVDFARSNGLTVTVKHPNRVVLDVEGAVFDIEKAFHIAFQVYQHPKEARTFFAPNVEPSLDLAVPILHISGLDNYLLPHPNSKIKPLSKGANTTPNSGSGPSGTYRGSDFRAAYIPGTSLTGAGQSVGLLQFDGYYASDITSYETQAGLPNIPLTNVSIDGGVAIPGDGNGEVCLDIEMVISMAPGVSRIYVYEAPNPSPWVDLLSRMANDNLAKQLSCSWGGGSPDPTAEAIFQQMAAQGQSFFNATGDSDAFTGAIEFPSESTNITEVGGTTLTTTGPAGSYLSETVWNWGLHNGQYVGSSGGISTYYTIPNYQLGISMAANMGSTTMRNVPDVALTADNVYVIYNNGGSGNFGGTSCAAPLWAGFTALVNEQAAAAGQSSVGFLNPAIYAIGRGANYPSDFHDTTTGNNTSASSPTQFYAVSGYDLCTGWGTPDGTNLINTLTKPEPLMITPSAGFTSSGEPGGPFTITSQFLSLSNRGTGSLTWSLVNTSLWLNVFPSGGTLTPGGASSAVMVSLNSVASNLVAGTYSATVWFTNLSDSVAQGRTFILEVLGPPVITSQPASQTVGIGGSATFNINASSLTPLSYFWRRDGTPIVGANASTYTTNNVQLSDNNSRFSCLVSNAYGSVISSNASLFVTQNLVQNGGFETGDFSSWTTGGFFIFSSVTASSPYVHSGAYGAKLGPFALLGYISQSLPTTSGQPYLVSFWIYSNGLTPNEFLVTWNGITLFDQVNVGATGWTNIQLAATATAQNTTLQFGFRNDPSYLGLDDIVVSPIVVPAFQTVSQTGGTIRFSWSAVAGLTYQVQYKTNLMQSNWMNLGASVVATNGTMTSSDSTTADKQRFYRIQRQMP